MRACPCHEYNSFRALKNTLRWHGIVPVPEESHVYNNGTVGSVVAKNGAISKFGEYDTHIAYTTTINNLRPASVSAAALNDDGWIQTPNEDRDKVAPWW